MLAGREDNQTAQTSSLSSSRVRVTVAFGLDEIKVAVGSAGIAGTGACAVFQITHNNKNLTLS